MLFSVGVESTCYCDALLRNLFAKHEDFFSAIKNTCWKQTPKNVCQKSKYPQAIFKMCEQKVETETKNVDFGMFENIIPTYSLSFCCRM